MGSPSMEKRLKMMMTELLKAESQKPFRKASLLRTTMKKQTQMKKAVGIKNFHTLAEYTNGMTLTNHTSQKHKKERQKGKGPLKGKEQPFHKATIPLTTMKKQTWG